MRIPISFPGGATTESGLGACLDLPEGQHWAVLALWEADMAARPAR